MSKQTLFMRVVNGSLTPADAESREKIGRLKEGRLIMIRAMAPRNPLQHRLLWHLARLVFENSEDFTSSEHVVEQMKIGTGLTDRVQLVVPGIGTVVQERGRSIAFESMPQAEFEEWFERVLDYAVIHLLPGVDKEEVRQQIESTAIGGVYKDAMDNRRKDG